MSDVSQILQQIKSGDAPAADCLLPLVYEELRKLAAAKLWHEKPDHSLTATALVHEVYLRLVGQDNDQTWDSKGHFFAAAAEAMRRILINRARDKKRLKRGGDRVRIDLSGVSLASDTPDHVLIELDDAIQQLEDQDPVSARLVKLRFFGGLTLSDASASLGLTRRQGDRLWAFARAWLFDQLSQDCD